MIMPTSNYLIPEVVVAATLLLILPGILLGHCDTMDGPVISDARKALESGRVAPVLKWVLPEDEQAITEAFNKTAEVRKAGGEAAGLADMYFFETLVRIHRASEGEPYSGLKPAGQSVEPAVEAADEALDRGDVDGLVEDIKSEVERQIIRRFQRVVSARLNADKSVENGREYVEAYVDYVHFIKGLADRIHGSTSHDH